LTWQHAVLPDRPISPAAQRRPGQSAQPAAAERWCCSKIWPSRGSGMGHQERFHAPDNTSQPGGQPAA